MAMEKVAKSKDISLKNFLIFEKIWKKNKTCCTFIWYPRVSQKNLESQLLHSKGFLPSWTDKIWRFSLPFSANFELHVKHSKGFFFSWTDATWPFKCPFCANFLWQISHSYNFSPSWSDAIWPFRCVFLAKLDSH